MDDVNYQVVNCQEWTSINLPLKPSLLYLFSAFRFCFLTLLRYDYFASLLFGKAIELAAVGCCAMGPDPSGEQKQKQTKHWKRAQKRKACRPAVRPYVARNVLRVSRGDVQRARDRDRARVTGPVTGPE